jgi:chemotaxis protein MotB
MAGGAWKVAYADFITAMMALFMVLWILGSEDELLEQLEEYFKNPPSPFTQESQKYVADTGDFSGNTGVDAKEAYYNRLDPAILKGVVSEFRRVLNMERNKDTTPPVEVTITSDGLRVSLFDRQKTPIFQPGDTELTPWADFLSQNLAWLIARYPFEIVVESYTSEQPPAGSDGWKDGDGAWELSTRRANVLRRRLQFYANDQLNFRSVVGYGDGTFDSEEAIASGKTQQRIALSLSLTDPSRLPDFSMVGDDLLVPDKLEQKRAPTTYE